MSDTALIPVEVQKKVEGEIASLVNGTTTLQVIESNPQYENAVALTKTVKSLANDIEEQRDALVRPRNDEVKAINAWFKVPQGRLEAVEKSLKGAIQRYQAAIEQRRLEAQRKADEEARKQREKIEAEARIQREKELAAQRAQEEARRRQEESRRAQEEAERRIREAADAEARKKAEEEAAEARKNAEAAAREEARERGKEEAAASSAQLKESVAESVVAVAVAPQISTPAGMSTAYTYAANVTDKVAAIKHCVETGKLHLVELNMVVINKMVKAEKEYFSMPGIEVVKKRELRMRAA